MRLKSVFRKIHLWLGLLSGLPVFIMGLTGSLYAFKEEILNATEKFRYISSQDQVLLAPSDLIEIAKNELPDKHVHAVMYPGKGCASRVYFYSPGPNEYYYTVYINPYNGEVLEVKNELEGFFAFIFEGHFYLWLPDEIGQVVAAVSTMIFIALLLSGLILWWPKNKHNKRQRFRIKWKADWKRKNFDMHAVAGFYIILFGLVFAITGLVWGFEWFAKSYYYVASGGGLQVEYYEPASKIQVIADSIPSVDRVYQIMLKDYPEGTAIEIHQPLNDSASIAANANPDLTTYWKTDYRYFDQYSLREQNVTHQWGRFQNANNAEKLMRMNYDIHTGAVWGIAGKLLACLSSLIIASLPVTGFMMWFGRKRNGRNKVYSS